MAVVVTRATTPEIARWRDLYRQEMHCQIIHDSLHEREGWTESFILRDGDLVAGYGSVAIAGPWQGKPVIFEFFVLPTFRQRVFHLFAELVAATGVTAVETQTNDVLLSTLLHSLAPRVESEAILFRDGVTTHYVQPYVVVRRATPEDAAQIAAAQLDDTAEWVIAERGAVVGTGGILYHYNRPYGDIFMHIAEPARRRGLGAYFVQELKAICYQLGSEPAARCNVANVASRLTLQRAGFVPCGNLVTGTVATATPR